MNVDHSLKPEQIWCIKQFDFLDVLTEAEQIALAERMHEKSYLKKETIYFDGDKSDMVYLVRSGKVRLTALDGEGNRLSLSLLKKGDLFGVLALAGQQRRNWTATAVANTKLVMIHRDDLYQLQRSNPNLGRKITQLVGEHGISIENKLQDLMFKSVKERLIHTLNNLARRHGKEQGSYINIRITQQELAHLIGATRESVSPALGELEDEGAIERSYGKIVVKELAKLK